MWRTVKLGDVVSYAKSNAQGTCVPYVGMENIASETMELIGEISIPESTSTTFEFDESHVLFARLRPYLRKVLVPGFRGQCSTEIFCLKPSRELLREYLAYWLLEPTVSKKIDATSTGARMPRANMNKLLEFDVTLPPLAEQQRIVAKLDAAFAEIDLLSYKNREKLRNCESLLEAGVQAVIDESLKEAELVELESLCDPGRGITYGVIKLGDEVDDGVPCLRTSNVKRRKITTHGMKRISRNLSDEYDRTILKGGEVLVNVRGTLGGVAVVPSDMIGWNISREVALVPVSTSKVEPEYLSLFISSQSSQKWLNRNTRGAAYQGINLSDLRKLLVYVPTKDEQLRIVHRLETLVSEFESLQKILDRTITELEKLKLAILAQELQPSEAA